MLELLLRSRTAVILAIASVVALAVPSVTSASAVRGAAPPSSRADGGRASAADLRGHVPIRVRQNLTRAVRRLVSPGPQSTLTQQYSYDLGWSVALSGDGNLAMVGTLE